MAAVGDMMESKVGFGGGVIAFRLRYRVDAVDADGYPTDRTPLQFAYVDERVDRSVTLRGGDFTELTDQYRSPSRESLTWHDITPPMRKFFRGGYASASFAGEP